jgi:hypothetical protein
MGQKCGFKVLVSECSVEPERLRSSSMGLNVEPQV